MATLANCKNGTRKNISPLGGNCIQNAPSVHAAPRYGANAREGIGAETVKNILTKDSIVLYCHRTMVFS